MKEYKKSLLIYLRTAFNPLMLLLGLIISCGILTLAVCSPETADSEDYQSAVSVIGYGSFGIFIIFLYGSISMSRSRFFASVTCAKQLYVFAPVTFAVAGCIIYDICAFTIISLKWGEGCASDLVILLGIDLVMTTFCLSCLGKKRLTPLYMIFVALTALQTAIVPKLWSVFGFFFPGVSLDLGIALLIAVCIAAAGVALNILILCVCWKRSDRFQPCEPAANRFFKA